MNCRERTVLKHIKNFEKIDQEEIAEHLGMDVFEVTRICARLVRDKKIKVVLEATEEGKAE